MVEHIQHRDTDLHMEKVFDQLPDLHKIGIHHILIDVMKCLVE
jgi:hypothetical protein